MVRGRRVKMVRYRSRSMVRDEMEDGETQEQHG